MSLSIPSLHSPSQIQLEGLGSAVSSLSESGWSPAAKRILVHFELKSRHLVIRNSVSVTSVQTLFSVFLSILGLLNANFH